MEPAERVAEGSPGWSATRGAGAAQPGGDGGAPRPGARDGRGHHHTITITPEPAERVTESCGDGGSVTRSAGSIVGTPLRCPRVALRGLRSTRGYRPPPAPRATPG